MSSERYAWCKSVPSVFFWWYHPSLQSQHPQFYCFKSSNGNLETIQVACPLTRMLGIRSVVHFSNAEFPYLGETVDHLTCSRVRCRPRKCFATQDWLCHCTIAGLPWFGAKWSRGRIGGAHARPVKRHAHGTPLACQLLGSAGWLTTSCTPMDHLWSEEHVGNCCSSSLCCYSVST